MADETAVFFRDQIIAVCLDAMRRRGLVNADRETIFRDPALTAEFLALLRDCRPLPAILDLIAEAEAAAGGALPPNR